MNQHAKPSDLAISGPALQTLRDAAGAAVGAVPPVWPIASAVAVNPFLGQSDQSLTGTAALLGKVAGTRILPERAHYAKKIRSGEITSADLAQAAARAGIGDAATLAAAAERPAAAPIALPTLADLAAELTGIDVPALVTERIGALAAQHFDAGQAGWQLVAPSLYAAWRDTASVDRTYDIAGLAALRGAFAAAPATAETAMHDAARVLDLPDDAHTLYFHRLLMTVPGWAQYARGQRWIADQKGRDDGAAADLLAIRLMWEAALLDALPEVGALWAAARPAYSTGAAPSAEDRIDAALQDAADIAARRALASALAAPAAPAAAQSRPALQAAFCIDVRSEVFRRALEAQDSAVETLGFAGFFGIAIEHRPTASDTTEARCPVLLTPSVTTRSMVAACEADRAREVGQSQRAWERFRSSAVSCFAFVETAGPAFLGKLVRDSLGKPQSTCAAAAPAPEFDEALPDAARIDMAEAVLRAMSLTGTFAPLVLLAGHGAQVTNNPHAAALDCGACGGHSGEENARLLANLLNAPEVRAGLAERGLSVPDDTRFVAALHDTTTDAVTLFDAPNTPEVAQAQAWLEAAGSITRGERAARLPGAEAARLPARAGDWAEVRPEWALAGCSAFIAAPRGMTAGRDLTGRAFLHSYEWEADAARDYPVLELILTAPVVVASWISLQYFGSTAAPTLFGGGDKLLHNVVGGIGVVEGNGGDLRPGLPFQSVHDGSDFVHDPLRLTVAIAAPEAAITGILERHPEVRALFDNGWLALCTLDENGAVARVYAGDLAWSDSQPDLAHAA
ncbi:MAG: DUF2309 domain-containing protein [Pseudomonadota bacterium]